MNDKLKGLLGMAQRARKIVIGETAMHAIRSRKASLVVLSDDCSPRTSKKILDKCLTYNVDIIRVGRSDELSWAVGRSNIVFVAICDEGFARAIKENS